AMDHDTLLYETDRHTGVPSLRPEGGPGGYSAAELQALDAELRPQYERLARGSVGWVELGGRRSAVEVRPGGNRRQPALVRRPESAAAAALRPPPEAGAGREAGFLAALQRLAGGSEPTAEQAALRFAVEELQAQMAAMPGELVPLLFGAYLQV